jgi:hypothetical protein
MPGVPTVSIAAPRPLLRAGLERLARDASTVIAEPGQADIRLRTGDVAAAGDLDVVIDDGTVCITCRTTPDPLVWDAVRRLVAVAIA